MLIILELKIFLNHATKEMWVFSDKLDRITTVTILKYFPFSIHF